MALTDNQPYDCGFFFTKSLDILQSVFQNPNAAYLSSSVSNIPSPLNIGLQNSRRFRALPVYSVLVAYGREGLQEMFVRQVLLARSLALAIHRHKAYELLPYTSVDEATIVSETGIVVLFRAKDSVLNEALVQKINAMQRVYMSGTSFGGQAACRIAVSTWKIDVERDTEKVMSVLQAVAGASESR
jgi:glutamate/tyrosine decarboxylase-like PLP-dependent enzyme